MRKDRLTSEKHTYLFNVSFPCHGSLHKEIKTCRVFWARFDEEWKVMKKMWWNKEGYEQSV